MKVIEQTLLVGAGSRCWRRLHLIYEKDSSEAGGALAGEAGGEGTCGLLWTLLFIYYQVDVRQTTSRVIGFAMSHETLLRCGAFFVKGLVPPGYMLSLPRQFT